VTDDLPPINFCVHQTEAEAAIREAIADAETARRWPIAIDIETAPKPAEVERLRGLNEGLATLKGERKAARKAKAPPTEIAAYDAQEKVLKARIKYVAGAGLDPSSSTIRAVQLHAGRRIHVIDVFRAGTAPLALLAGVDVVIHNAGFDLGFFEEIGIGFQEIHCTAQGSRLTLGEWSMSLDDAAKAHLGVDLNKSRQKSDWSAPNLAREQIEYAAADVEAIWRLSRCIFPALGVQRPAYAIQAAVVPAVSRMQRRGVLMDVEAHARFISSLEAERVEKAAEYEAACRGMGLSATAAPTTPNEIRAAIASMLTSDELDRWRRTEKSGALSVARAELRRAAHYPPDRAARPPNADRQAFILFRPDAGGAGQPDYGQDPPLLPRRRGKHWQGDVLGAEPSAIPFQKEQRPVPHFVRAGRGARDHRRRLRPDGVARRLPRLEGQRHARRFRERRRPASPDGLAHDAQGCRTGDG
jgi:hypothetical protein